MTLILVAIALVSFGLYGTGYAFHGGGVAQCEGCHTMHNSLNGVEMRTRGGLTLYNAGPYLLQGVDSSSACLNCHGSGDATSGYHVSTESVTAGGATVPNQYTPGGDFSWVKITANSLGSKYGHNIVAAGFSYVADSRFTGNSPGGSFPAASLGCTSCHDPHGQSRLTDAVTNTYQRPSIGTKVLPIGESGSYGAVPTAEFAVGAYRLLGGSGYQPKGTAVTFSNQVPTAVAPNSYNRSETAGTGQTRVAYGKGMSEWCANCHTSIHNNNYPATRRHPAADSEALGVQAGIYNAYISSGDLTGTDTTSFNSLVPFEMQDTNRTNLAAVAGPNSTSATINPGQLPSLQGPDAANDNVMCVSCHRVHASGFASMTRFGVVELITDETGVFEKPTGFTDAMMQAAYYGRPGSFFGNAQRNLCNKCHAKD